VDKKERKQSQDEIIAIVREKLNQLPGVRIYIEGLSDTGDRPVAVSLTCADPERLGEASDIVVKLLEEMDGVVDVTSSYRPGSPRLVIRMRDSRAHDLV